MPDENEKKIIVVKRIVKNAHGHHGGAWKVAYADFVTAMMAFFLLMWLMGSTTDAQRSGISDFFQHPGIVPDSGGASASLIDLNGNGSDPLPNEPAAEPSSPEAEDSPEAERSDSDTAPTIEDDKVALDQLLLQVRQEIKESPQLQDFKDQLFLDITSEGLRIQIVDSENRPMFDLGSDTVKPYMVEILNELAPLISVPNYISITGHTDAKPYKQPQNSMVLYSNWELSADRANAARRVLVTAGMDPSRIGRIVGFSSTVLLDKENPYSPTNRRISIIILNHHTERQIGFSQYSDGTPGSGRNTPRPVDDGGAENQN